MLVDNVNRLARLRRKYSNFSGASKRGPYRRILITRHGLAMLEEMKRRNPKVSYDDLVCYSLSVTLDTAPIVPADEGDDSTLKKVEDIMSMHGHTIKSWCNYHRINLKAFRNLLRRIDLNRNMFTTGKADLQRSRSVSGRERIGLSSVERAFQEDFNLDVYSLAGSDFIRPPEKKKGDPA